MILCLIVVKNILVKKELYSYAYFNENHGFDLQETNY